MTTTSEFVSVVVRGRSRARWQIGLVGILLLDAQVRVALADKELDVTNLSKGADIGRVAIGNQAVFSVEAWQEVEQALVVPNAALRFQPPAATSESKESRSGLVGMLFSRPPSAAPISSNMKVNNGQRTLYVLREDNQRLIALEHISRGHGSGAAEVHALRDVSLQIASGEFVAIMGASGSGKSMVVYLTLPLHTGVTRLRYRLLDGRPPRQIRSSFLRSRVFTATPACNENPPILPSCSVPYSSSSRAGIVCNGPRRLSALCVLFWAPWLSGT